MSEVTGWKDKRAKEKRKKKQKKKKKKKKKKTKKKKQKKKRKKTIVDTEFFARYVSMFFQHIVCLSVRPSVNSHV